MSEQPQGRPLKELRALVQASHERLRRIEDAWDSLTDDEQEDLASQAEAMESEAAAREAS